MTVRLHKKIDTLLERARLARAVIAQADAGAIDRLLAAVALHRRRRLSGKA
jgi:hypothetical protein